MIKFPTLKAYDNAELQMVEGGGEDWVHVRSEGEPVLINVFTLAEQDAELAIAIPYFEPPGQVTLICCRALNDTYIHHEPIVDDTEDDDWLTPAVNRGLVALAKQMNEGELKDTAYVFVQ